jgi:hypothetical protein
VKTGDMSMGSFLRRGSRAFKSLPQTTLHCKV